MDRYGRARFAYRLRADAAPNPPTTVSPANLQAHFPNTNGTWDVDGRFVKVWREHALSHDTAPPGRNWLLVVEGADHYLGNLICRPEREAVPQTDALAMVNASAVTFLDAFVKDDAAAKVFLDARPLADLTGGFATLTQR